MTSRTLTLTDDQVRRMVSAMVTAGSTIGSRLQGNPLILYQDTPQHVGTVFVRFLQSIFNNCMTLAGWTATFIMMWTTGWRLCILLPHSVAMGYVIAFYLLQSEIIKL